MEIGLFLSTCDGVVGDAIDLEALTQRYGHLPSVLVVDDFYETQHFNRMLDEVVTKKLDGVVLAGESPIAFKQARNGDFLFKCLAQRGVNPNRIEVVNLKNMVVRPHQADREALQSKAQLLVDSAIDKVRASHPIATVEISPRKAVAIIGANSASLVLAQHLLEAGCKVFLVNRDARLTIPRAELVHLQPTLSYLEHHERFTLFNEATVVDFHGFTGDYQVEIKSGETAHSLPIGAAVLSLENNLPVLKELQAIFHIDIDDAGRLAAKDEHTARSLTHDRGVFVINPIQTQSADLAATLLAADATAVLMLTLLNQKEIQHQVAVTEVHGELCGGCGACVKTCMFHAVTMSGEPLVSSIDARRCRGCGNCVTACPAGARDLVSCPSSYLSSAVTTLAQFKPAPGEKKMLLMACDGCGYLCLNRASEAGLTWPVSVMPLHVVCGGQIDTQLIMQAFVSGFDAVILAICGEGCCHNLMGNVDLERRVNLLKEVLTSRGVDPARVHIVATCSRNGAACVESVNKYYDGFGAKKAPPAQAQANG